DPLPPVYEQERGGLVVTSYPALIDEGDSVGIGLRENPAEAARAHWAGLRKLLMLTTPSPMRQITRTLGNRAKLALRQAPHGSLDALLEDCRRCAVDALMAQNDAAKVRTPEEFAALRRAVEAGQVATAHEVVELTQRILAEAATVHLHLNAAPEPAAADLRAQLGALIYPGFVTVTGWTQLPEIARYLQAMVRRMQRLPGDLARDREWTAAVHEVVLEYQQVAARVGNSPELLRIRWMIEELRVSYFAQSLGTPYPISPQRIYRAMDKL
ncbi:MAG TPA: DUF3418 domain-containing protein, partial [Mycobacteriales bacterium]|nr:DUF3418 domain-containing protein [Mycobacteriales bacterium]